MHRRRTVSLVLFLPFVLGGLFAPARAELAVQFLDGRSLEVESLEVAGDVARLELVGGGAIAVPAEQIEDWSELPAGTPDPATPEAAPPDEQVWKDAAGEYAGLIEQAASRHDLDPALLASMAQVESAFDPLAVSSKGAQGLLQLMPDTARRFGVEDSFDVVQNVEAGARYLSWLLERYEGRTDLALAGYNAGEGAVDRFRGIPPYRETRKYVDRVMSGAAMLARSAP